MLLGIAPTAARSFGPTVPPADVFDLDFTAGADAAALAAAGFAFARASVGWDENQTAYAANVPAITAARGLRVEGPATNVYLQSSAPATRTVALAAGTFTLWCRGPGSVALSGAAAGAATAATPLQFTLAAAGSVTVTPSGGPSFAAVEDGPYPTTPIITTTAAVTRAAASCVATGRTGLGQGTLLLRLRSARGSSSVAEVAWQADDGSNSNRFKVDRGPNAGLRLVVTVAGVAAATLAGGHLADDTVVNVLVAWDATGFLLRSGLGPDQTTAAAPVAGVARELLGTSAGSSAPWDGALERAARWSTRLAPVHLDVLLASGAAAAGGNLVLSNAAGSRVLVGTAGDALLYASSAPPVSGLLALAPAGDHLLLDPAGDRLLLN